MNRHKLATGVAVILLAGCGGVDIDMSKPRIAVTAVELSPEITTEAAATASHAALAYSNSAPQARHEGFVRGMVEDAVSSIPGALMLERQAVDKIVEEMDFSTSELGNPKTALKLGQLLGANVLVTVSILKLDHTASTSAVYGIEQAQITCESRIRVRAYRATDGVVLYSQQFTGQAASSTDASGTVVMDIDSKAIEAAVAQFRSDGRFTTAIQGFNST